jgi:hypothetical protein
MLNATGATMYTVQFGFFGTQMPLVICDFPSFNLLDDVVNRCQTQGLVMILILAALLVLLARPATSRALSS